MWWFLLILVRCLWRIEVWTSVVKSYLPKKIRFVIVCIDVCINLIATMCIVHFGYLMLKTYNMSRFGGIFVKSISFVTKYILKTHKIKDQNWNEQLNNSSKCSIYRIFKAKFQIESYLRLLPEHLLFFVSFLV